MGVLNPRIVVGMVTNNPARVTRIWFTMGLIAVMLAGGGPAPTGIRPDREEVLGMRVTRRTRPSQVGCGASAARRRLFHAQANASPPALDFRGPVSKAELSMVIQIDRFDAGETPTRRAQRTGADGLEDQVLVVAGSSPRGW
jgi:hypothetical protein